MKKNYLRYSFILTFTVILILFSGYFFTPFSIGDFTIKKMNILSDLKLNKENSDLVKTEKIIVPEKIDPDCPPNIICIEEFSSRDNAMKHFYDALDSISLLDRPIRIGFYGDSFIGGDIMTCDIRDRLQKIYGGCGVGYMPLTSEAPGFRKTVIHGFQNITTESLIQSSSEPGISGYAFKAEQNAGVFYKGVDKPGLNEFSVVRLLYQGKSRISASYRINKKDAVPVESDTIPGVHCAVIRDSVQSIDFYFSPGMVIYGVYLDCDKGVAVDNFSIRGHSGLNLRNISQANLQQTNKLLHYDLIVLQYGLNVAGTNTVNFDEYKKNMLKNIAHIKTAFPDASIILMGVGDRSVHYQGNYVTMPGILNLLPVQKEIAATSHIAFWDLFQAMGGENGMTRFVSAQPPLAAKDYTHLSFEGGKVIATQFVNALLYGKKQYDRTKNKSAFDYPELL